VVERVGEKKEEEEEEEKRKKGGRGPFILSTEISTSLPLLRSAVCRTIRTLIKPQFSCEPLNHSTLPKIVQRDITKE
jgi:hypothetical protein